MSDENESAPVSAAVKPDQKRRLGRGLGALLGEARREEPLVAQRVPLEVSAANANEIAPAPAATQLRDGLASIAVASIAAHPDQPRRHFDEDALNELAASIAANTPSNTIDSEPDSRPNSTPNAETTTVTAMDKRRSLCSAAASSMRRHHMPVLYWTSSAKVRGG